MGEEKAIAEMKITLGTKYPEKGMLLAMGTHRRWRDKWLINGIIRLDSVEQLPLF